MQVYRRKTLLSENADFATFTKLYGESVADVSHDPFLLIRDDDYRLLVITDDGMVMLSLRPAQTTARFRMPHRIPMAAVHSRVCRVN